MPVLRKKKMQISEWSKIDVDHGKSPFCASNGFKRGQKWFQGGVDFELGSCRTFWLIWNTLLILQLKLDIWNFRPSAQIHRNTPRFEISTKRMMKMNQNWIKLKNDCVQITRNCLTLIIFSIHFELIVKVIAATWRILIDSQQNNNETRLCLNGRNHHLHTLI